VLERTDVTNVSQFTTRPPQHNPVAGGRPDRDLPHRGSGRGPQLLSPRPAVARAIADQVDHIADRAEQLVIYARFQCVQGGGCLRGVIRLQGHALPPVRMAPPHAAAGAGRERVDVCHQAGPGQQPGLAGGHDRRRAKDHRPVRLHLPQIGTRRPRRLRANIVFAAEEPFVEEQWQGKLLDIGRVRLRVTERVARCRMIDIAQDGARPDGRWLKPLGAERDMFLAMYADVDVAGFIAVGDRLSVEGRGPAGGGTG
jgi:MOSC domain